jgi:small subunit ribosomal protein S3
VGNKTHPIGFRLGIVKDWQTRWFAAKQEDYRALVKEDIGIRNVVMEGNEDAGISRVEIERGTNELVVTAHTARPGIVIGRGGAKVDEMRKQLEQLTNGRVRLNVQEIRQPELDAFLVARNIADQLERRVAYRRAVRQTVQRTSQAGARGVKVQIAGRLGGAEIARREKAMDGRVPLHTLRADIDYGFAEASTTMGRIGVKVWIYRGSLTPQQRIRPAGTDDTAPIAAPTPEPAAEEPGPVAEAPAPAVEETAPAEEASAPEPAGEPAPQAEATTEEMGSDASA